ncbi:uncharacterized protein LOC142620362 [Castanea sativa]|uniref:uncharacterized protein LOC142620362 n=1 Tax=Castanea sativa TaxID=21020 RepID=UPI003F64B1A1
MVTQAMVREGIKWRVGNGRNIRVWVDRWLPSGPTHRVASPRLFLHPNTLVGELIDQENARWKLDVLAPLFLPYEDDIIQSIPLSSRIPEDNLVWAESPNRKFNVRSAYATATRLSLHPHRGASSDLGLGWLEVETTKHAFLTCPRARKVWACSKIVFPSGALSLSSFYDLIWKMLMMDQVDVDRVARVVTLAWAIWHNRNEVRQGAQRKTGNDYRSKDGRIVGVGVIVRDELGRVEAAMCRNLNTPLGAIKTESMAIEAGLLFAKDIGIQDIMVESDSLILVKALNGTFVPPSAVSIVVQGILDHSLSFYRVEFSHVKRQGNRPTHVLAKHALSIVDFIAWIEEVPCFLEQTLIHDVTSQVFH